MTTTPELDDLRAALLDLTPAQQIAAEALAGGTTHADAADAASVARETVTRWAGHHPGFRAALHRYRAALAREQADLARSIRARALTRVHDQLDDADLSDALAVLRAIPEPPEPNTITALATDPAAILAAEVRRTKVHLPPPPAPPLMARFDDPPPSNDQLADQLTVTRLADAADIMETR